MASRFLLLVSIVAVSMLFEPLSRRARVLGITRLWSPAESMHGHDARVIANTPHAEDLHYHEPSGLLFTAAEPNTERRWSWFPAMAMLDHSAGVGQGSIVVVDSQTAQAKTLDFVNFDEPFITHGIDIWSSPTEPNTVYIFAVNHLTNPSYSAGSDNTVHKARSRIELFQHKIGSTSVTHIRSVWHPLIRTPNDVLAISPTEFYLTNCHFYRDGVQRFAEDIDFPGLSKKTDIVHVSLSSLSVSNDSDAVTATVAITGLHNNNGLGYGASRDEILVGRAAAGVIEVTKKKGGGPQLEVVEKIQLDTSIDNPSYFHDAYAKETGTDSSGYVIAGLTSAVTWPNPNGVNPVVVWLVQPSPNTENGKKIWTKRIIFQDDGNLISSASTAVLVPIKPSKNGGKKQARLFVTGPVSKAMVVSTIDL